MKISDQIYLFFKPSLEMFQTIFFTKKSATSVLCYFVKLSRYASQYFWMKNMQKDKRFTRLNNINLIALRRLDLRA